MGHPMTLAVTQIYASCRLIVQDFSDIVATKFLVIDENTRVQEFSEKLRWNDLYYHLNKGL
jgi:L-arabinose isomerase